jgi:molecular chaperone HtpG
LAIANATGLNAPKTNVARASLEDTPERLDLIRRIYNLYRQHLEEEARRLISVERKSLSWVMNQMPFIASALREDNPSSAACLEECLENLPIFLLEDSTERKSASMADLRSRGSFWTVESPLTSHVEGLISEMPVQVTARALIQVAGQAVPRLPEGDLVSNLPLSSMARIAVEKNFEVQHIRAFEDSRRVDLKWGPIGDDQIWISRRAVIVKMETIDFRSSRLLFEHINRRSRGRIGAEILIPARSVSLEGLGAYQAIQTYRGLYILPGCSIAHYFLPMMRSNDFRTLSQAFTYLEVFARLLPISLSDGTTGYRFDRIINELAAEGLDHGDITEFRSAVLANEIRVFNPFAWSRRSDDDPDYY